MSYLTALQALPPWLLVLLPLLLSWVWRSLRKGQQQQRGPTPYSGPPRISALLIYPIKSCSPLSLSTSRLDRMGLEWDRRFLVINSSTGRQQTQREYQRLVLIEPRLDFESSPPMLRLTARGEEGGVSVPLHPDPSSTLVTRVGVSVWDDKFDALAYTDPAISAWLGKVLRVPEGRAPLNLVTLLPHDEHIRPLEAQFDRTQVEDRVCPGFSDQFPILLASNESLHQVNEWTRPNGREVDMRAFRPNIVVEGCKEAFDEDYWRLVHIGGEEEEGQQGAEQGAEAPARSCTFWVSKPNGRCAMTTIDPDSGVYHPSGEPLRSLREHRKILEHVPSQNGECMFGQYLAPVQLKHATLRVGDPVRVLERRPYVYDPTPQGIADKDKPAWYKQLAEVGQKVPVGAGQEAPEVKTDETIDQKKNK